MNDTIYKTDAQLIEPAQITTIDDDEIYPTIEPITDNTDIEVPHAQPAILDTTVLSHTRRKPTLMSPFGYKDLDYDIDTKLFKNTCLNKVVLTDNEIGLLKNRLKRVKNVNLFIADNMPYYCNIRNIVLTNMPDFEEKYPRVYAKLLYLCFENAESRQSSTIQNIVQFILNHNEIALRNMDNSTRLNETSQMLNDMYKIISKPTYRKITKTLKGGIKKHSSNKTNKKSKKTKQINKPNKTNKNKTNKKGKKGYNRNKIHKK